MGRMEKNRKVKGPKTETIGHSVGAARQQNGCKAVVGLGVA